MIRAQASDAGNTFYDVTDTLSLKQKCFALSFLPAKKNNVSASNPPSLKQTKQIEDCVYD